MSRSKHTKHEVTADGTAVALVATNEVAVLPPPPAVITVPAPVVRVARPLIHKSAIEGPVARVFALCNKMQGARRCDVVKACEAEGIATYTARTQYQRWFTKRKVIVAAQATQ